MEKIQEQLNLPTEENYQRVRTQMTAAWRDMAKLVNNLLTVYYQDAMPTIPTNTTSLWIDTNAGPKYYIIANFGGTMKKVELT